MNASYGSHDRDDEVDDRDYRLGITIAKFIGDAKSGQTPQIDDYVGLVPLEEQSDARLALWAAELLIGHVKPGT